MSPATDPDRVPDVTLWRSVAATLGEVVVPGLPPGHERDTAVQLQGLARYAAGRPDDDAARRLSALAGVLPGDPVPDLAGALTRAGRLLAAAVEHPQDRARAAQARLVRAVLLQLLDEDVEQAAPLLETFSGHPAVDVPPADRVVPDAESAALAAWFGRALGGAVQLTRAVVLSGGHSRRMLRVDLDGPAGQERLVVRIEQGGTFGTDGTVEALAMQALGGAGVPVAPVRFVERDRRPLGQPFFVMDLVPGGSAVDDIVLGAFLRALHRVHQVDPAVLTGVLGPPPGPEQAVQAQVDRWEEVYRASVRAPVPLLEEAAAWLRRELRATGPTVVVHGDPGPGNFLHENGEITALTDWEFVHHGDAAEDWSYFATLRSRRLRSAAEWYDEFERAVGVRHEPAQWHAWEVFNLFKGACANLTARRLFRDGTATTPNLLAIGTAVHVRFLRRLADLLPDRTPTRPLPEAT